MNGSCPWMWYGKVPEEAEEGLNYSELHYHPSRLYWDSEHQAVWWWPHLLAASLSSLSTVLSNWHHSFGNSGIRTPKCYVNSSDSSFPFFMILWSDAFSTSCASGTPPWREQGVRNGIGCYCGWGLMGRLWLIGGECLNYYGEAVSFSWFRETSVSINSSSVVVLINPSYWTGTISCLFYLKAYLGECFLNKSLRSVWFLIICPVFAVHVQIQLSDFLVSFFEKIVIESKAAGTLS